MSVRFRKSFTALPQHIDELGHVNNIVWVQWVQDLATEHWRALAAPEHDAAFIWVVVRHEIDYRGNVDVGDSVTAETWIEGQPLGATSLRRVDFSDAAGKVIVSAATNWAMLDRASGRLVRVRPEVVAPFFA
ncbi:acyl-CoA thioesterase [Qipengyuania marisflavi]|uniref:Acyl-CoA thioesterase n=1 Tax=Qipengyuania marisflavi TaxID=2486356 RepID=A0A5S3P811_9SPHN|nr:acyl-CoA thioesterase [Qipengyuania marisflavi]TMM48383.1 acyl-CoA thioesterase [Qipengyuania marisflavi]